MQKTNFAQYPLKTSTRCGGTLVNLTNISNSAINWGPASTTARGLAFRLNVRQIVCDRLRSDRREDRPPYLN